MEILKALEDSLSQVAVTVSLEGVPLENKIVKLEDSEVTPVVRNVYNFLSLLENRNFFAVLGLLPAITGELKHTWAAACYWELPDLSSYTIQTLSPICNYLAHLSLQEIHDVLWNLKCYLEQAGGHNWNGDHLLQHLSRIQADLEAVKPKETLVCLGHLNQLLTVQRCSLEWLAGHPFVQGKLGYPNCFHRLVSIRQPLEAMLHDGAIFFELQETLEILSKMEAIVRSPPGGGGEEDDEEEEEEEEVTEEEMAAAAAVVEAALAGEP